MDMMRTGVGPCGATLWQFHRVADSSTCAAVHVRQARFHRMKLQQGGAHMGGDRFSYAQTGFPDYVLAI